MRIKILFYTVVCTLFTYTASAAEKWGWATLIAPQNSTTVTLLDTNSSVIKTWTGLSGQTGYACYLMPGGYLWRSVKTSNSSFSGGGLCGRVQKVDWNGNILFDYTISNSTELSHHDICPMPNGNVMLIVYEKKTGTQMTAAGCTSSVAKQLEKIVELQPTGTNTANIVWQWNLYDHLCQNTNSNGANYVSSIVQNPQLMNVNFQANMSDWWHMNGIDYNAELDLVVVSAHNMHEMYVIDHSTTTSQAAGHTGGVRGKGGDFLYRWGNPAAYGANGTKIFNVIHDAHWIPNDCPKAGWLVGFNNQGVSSTQSCVDMFQTTWNGTQFVFTTGQQIPPATYGKRIACTNASGNNGYSSNMSNSQQLPNGNSLISLALSGYVYEVDSNNNKLWQYSLASGNIAQASRYSRCFIQNPSVSITNNAPSVCAGSTTPLALNTTASATAVSNFTYSWSPATGLSSTSVANPSVTNISQPTTYTVTMSTGECTATASVQVGTLPSPPANAGNDVTISSGQSTTLTATGGTSFVWSNGAATASTIVNPTSTTTYTVTVTNAQGCSATDQVVVTVSGGVFTVTALTSDNEICEGDQVQLDAVPSGGSGNYTYTWSSIPVGFASTAKNPNTSPAVNTVYTVVASDGSATASASVSVTVHSLPLVSAGNDVSISSGSSTVLTASGATSFVWSNGPATASQTVTPASTTTYSVTGTDANGCTASDAVVVTVTGGPLSVNIALDFDTICDGEAAQLFANASGGSGTYGYNWSSNPAGLSSTLYNPYINPSQTTVYTVTVSDGSTTVTATKTLVVLALPAKPSITVNDTLLVSSSATNNQWFYYGNPVSGGTGQILDPTIDGSYQVQVIDPNGCASPLSEPYEYIAAHVGISHLMDSKIVLYPNPTESIVYVKGVEQFSSFSLRLFDGVGQRVLEIYNSSALDVSALSAGVYAVHINTPEGNAVKRLVVSK